MGEHGGIAPIPRMGINGWRDALLFVLFQFYGEAFPPQDSFRQRAAARNFQMQQNLVLILVFVQHLFERFSCQHGMIPFWEALI